MPKRKENEQFALLGRKDCWHTYGLQVLATQKFARVVTSILSGRHTLITSKYLNRNSTAIN